MDASEDIRQLLTEIRDAQRAHLEEYKKTAARALATQENAVERQTAVAAFARRTILLGGAAIIFVIAILLWLILRFF